MSVLKISEDLRPLSDMKTRPSDVVTQVQKTGRPVVLTRYGKGVAVVLSVESFEELQSAAAKLRLIAALEEAERAADRGEVVEHSVVESILNEWESEDAEQNAHQVDTTGKARP